MMKIKNVYWITKTKIKIKKITFNQNYNHFK